MKTIWNVETRAMNGTVTIQTHIDSFTTEELARRVAKEIYEKNRKDVSSSWNVIVSVHESNIYEHEFEVPILNETSI